LHCCLDATAFRVSRRYVLFGDWSPRQLMWQSGF